ncbi:anti-sigma factor [Catenulispora sp. NF23]|uniref:Anti-sigma factor n=1 Tax=Catenulispora pinistramenti TaxID=2705254 RepID=A0ABS5L8W9_9ACTN|nr:anti-sigma factor [Catenulispora pinistramenti]MBS2539731.1 anti-sigma factor [Catenulispora pinistramenti]MBS2554520.1 anti-sigma factor [Catenulispora pinistramenti]
MEESVEASKVDDKRVTTERKLRAVPVLLLSCVVFGLAAAAFAWTTLRVHDRQMSAEANEKAVAFLLGTPGLQTAEQPAAGGGSVTAFYSPKLHRFAITGHDLPALSKGSTYEFWYLTGTGAAPKPAGDSRFDAPQNDMVVVSLPAGAASLEVSVEPSGGAHTLSGTPIAHLPLH